MSAIAHPANFWSRAGRGAEQQFKMHHQLRHSTYDLAASAAGKSLPGLDLSGQITPDWLARHASRHATYRVIVAKATSAPTCDLASLDWGNDAAVRAWVQYHASLHADLDAFFGLKS